MPELPEVEVVRRGLEPHVTGQRIATVDVIEPRSLRRHTPGPLHFAEALAGMQISAVARRGKFLWTTFEDCDDALLIHLGMSGQLRVTNPDVDSHHPADPSHHEGPASAPERHLRIRLTLNSGTRISFVDQRIFGGMQLSLLVPTADGAPAWPAPHAEQIPAAASHIARDLLDPHMDQQAIVAKIRGRTASIKSLLLAQNIVSGIGNIYADEALWEARVHASRPGNSLAPRSIHRILDSARTVMERALDVGGTSFDLLYVNVDGRTGYFARSLNAYGREGHPCRRCGTTMKRAQFSKRSATFCPTCQRTARSSTQRR